VDTCSDPRDRTIAFDDDKQAAAVASSCTLVAERLRKVWRTDVDGDGDDGIMDMESLPYPASLGTLVLGVILLDSVNLSPEAGKVTSRDSTR